MGYDGHALDKPCTTVRAAPNFEKSLPTRGKTLRRAVRTEAPPGGEKVHSTGPIFTGSRNA